MARTRPLGGEQSQGGLEGKAPHAPRAASAARAGGPPPPRATGWAGSAPRKRARCGPWAWPWADSRARRLGGAIRAGRSAQPGLGPQGLSTAGWFRPKPRSALRRPRALPGGQTLRALVRGRAAVSAPPQRARVAAAHHTRPPPRRMRPPTPGTRRPAPRPGARPEPGPTPQAAARVLEPESAMREDGPPGRAAHPGWLVQWAPPVAGRGGGDWWRRSSAAPQALWSPEARAPPTSGFRSPT